MQTYRCRLCGHVLGAFVTAVPGLALPFSHEAAARQVQAAKEQHRDWCPGERQEPARRPVQKPAPEPVQEPARKPAAKKAPVGGVAVEPT
jgi:hypothetical protein